ncbi:unnamed protein product [Eruca vesicaria subsp. sativa]|uniref:Uncharacterized protein n=1 Tax=Eruca vesicaria subsp. sativa TaxID=29727 RepID=A0ABC8L1N7_ERUVS|nr:unnamed protein product [Eruca vesicaria subsp. sativa]
MELVQRQGKIQPDSRASSLRRGRRWRRREEEEEPEIQNERRQKQVVWMDKVGEELSIGVCDVSEVKEVKHKVEEEDKHGDDYSTLYILAYFFTRKSFMTARDFPNAAANQPLQAPKEFRKALKITSLRPYKFYIHLSSLVSFFLRKNLRKRRITSCKI